MAPKPKKKSAFMIFCNRYRYQMSARNGVEMDLKQAISLAGPLWSKMSEEEREKYKDKAKSANAAVAQKSNNGPPVVNTKKAEEATKKHELKVHENITSTVHCMAAVGSLQYFNICIFHVNTFCYDERQKRHYPAELAIAKFNLKQGVWDVYHAICTPGPFPLGYAASVQAKADESHQLPIPDPMAPSNVEKTFFEMVSFVDDRRRNKPPPVYVSPNNFTEAKEFLSTLSKDYRRDPLFLEVHSLSQLFYQMRNASAGKSVYHSETLATKELERDEYELASGIACTVHDDLGVPFKCSKSIVTRMAYIICKHCCPELNIIPVPGKHIPGTTEKKPPSPTISDVSHPEQVKIKQEIESSDSDDDDEEASFSSEESETKPDLPDSDEDESKVDLAAPAVSAIVSCSYDDDDYMFL